MTDIIDNVIDLDLARIGRELLRVEERMPATALLIRSREALGFLRNSPESDGWGMTADELEEFGVSLIQLAQMVRQEQMSLDGEDPRGAE